jgi:hypothetical protein
MADYTNPYLGLDNPYLTKQIDNAQGDLIRNYNMIAQPAFNNAMVKSGSFGNAGVQQMNENSNLNLTNSLGRISTDMRGADYNNQQGMYRWDQEFGRNLYNDAYGQRNQDLQTQVGLLDRTQAYNTNDLQNATTQQNAPLNYWQQFTNSANSIGSGYGTTTSTNTGGGSNPWLSALGGAQLGGALWNSYNTPAATKTASTDPYASAWGATGWGQ